MSLNTQRQKLTWGTSKKTRIHHINTDKINSHHTLLGGIYGQRQLYR